MADSQKEKPKSWKEAPTPAWLVWITAIFLVVGAFFLLWTAGFPEYLLALLIFVTGAVLLYFAAYIHGNWYVRKAVRQPPKPAERTPTAFLKKCVKCGVEIPIASEECPNCGHKQP